MDLVQECVERYKEADINADPAWWPDGNFNNRAMEALAALTPESESG